MILQQLGELLFGAGNNPPGPGNGHRRDQVRRLAVWCVYRRVLSVALAQLSHRNVVEDVVHRHFAGQRVQLTERYRNVVAQREVAGEHARRVLLRRVVGVGHGVRAGTALRRPLPRPGGALGLLPLELYLHQREEYQQPGLQDILEILLVGMFRSLLI